LFLLLLRPYFAQKPSDEQGIGPTFAAVDSFLRTKQLGNIPSEAFPLLLAALI
jgi:hypothetical protein